VLDWPPNTTVVVVVVVVVSRLAIVAQHLHRSPTDRHSVLYMCVFLRLPFSGPADQLQRIPCLHADEWCALVWRNGAKLAPSAAVYSDVKQLRVSSSSLRDGLPRPARAKEPDPQRWQAEILPGTASGNKTITLRFALAGRAVTTPRSNAQVECLRRA
jgi:hypothetical protein